MRWTVQFYDKPMVIGLYDDFTGFGDAKWSLIGAIENWFERWWNWP